MKNKLYLRLLPLLACLMLAGCHVAAPVDAEPLEVLPVSTESTILESKPSESPKVTEDLIRSMPEGDPAEETAKVPSLQEFLRISLLPVGETAYVWGGGWNEEDTGAGPEACTIGVSPRWKEFSQDLTSDYEEENYRYQIHDGLDCSGFVGWAVYNVFETESGREGYVYASDDTAKTYASFGWGDFTPKNSVKDWKPGDIASMSGHVWICLGTCEDESVLLVHASPPGVRLCGTKGKKGTSKAVALAEKTMQEFWPDWYERFPKCEVPASYLKAAQMRWNMETFPDAEEIQSLTPEELLALLLPEAADK